MKRLGFVKPVITAAGILALSGVGFAQTPSQSHREASARAHKVLSSAPCPLPRVTKDKITEDEARDLAQKYADKNWAGFKVERPLGYGGGYTTMCYQNVASLDNKQPTSRASGAVPRSRDDSTTAMGKDNDSKEVSVFTAETRKPDSNIMAAKDTDRFTATVPARPLVLYSVEYSMDVKNSAGETRNLCVDQFGTVSEFCSSFGMAGATGPAGPIGPAGPAGAQGAAGPMGTQATVAEIKNWASFSNFLFDTDKSDVRANETSKVADIAAYMQKNASVQVGIDGFADPRGTDPYNQALSERRVIAIRDALVSAGVVTGRIRTGAFGESQVKCHESTEACWQSDRRVEVLMGTPDLATR